MVAYTRKTPGVGPIRPVTLRAVSPNMQFRFLNLPVPIEVVEDSAGRPVAVDIPLTINNRPTFSRRLAQQQPSTSKLVSQKITAINDLWQVNDEWWREHPISRRYYQITTQKDRRLTIFRDDMNGNWYWQKGG